MKKGTVYALSVSSERGQLKQEVFEVEIIEDYGIKGDGHAEDWGRQVTCLSCPSVQKANQEHRAGY